MLLYLRMVLPSSRTPPPQFSASSTNRRTTHLAGRRRQPLTPQTWASPAEPLAPRHVRLPLTPPPRASPASADEDTRSLTPDIIPHDAPHTQLEPTNPHPAACTATRRRDNRGLAFPAAEAVRVDHVRRSQHTGHPGLFSCRLSLHCSTAAAAGVGPALLAAATAGTIADQTGGVAPITIRPAAAASAVATTTAAAACKATSCPIPGPAACTATRRRDNRGLAFPAAEAVKVDHVRRSQHTGHPGLFSCRLSLRCSTAAAAGAGSTLLASATSWVSSPCSCCLRDWTARCTVPTCCGHVPQVARLSIVPPS